MFIGHFAPAALGASTGKLKLWQAFLGAQLVDIFWAGLILTGIEKVRITPGFTQASPLDLFHMPYTHALGMDVIWAGLAIVMFALVFRTQARMGAVIFGLVVLSHWVMDYIVHVPDLPLWFGGEKYGLGLWTHRVVSFSLEVLITLLALLMYLRASTSKPASGQDKQAQGKQAQNKQTQEKKKRVNWGRISPMVLIVVLILLQIISNFGPPPSSIPELSASAFLGYGLLIGLAAWVDYTRTI